MNTLIQPGSLFGINMEGGDAACMLRIKNVALFQNRHRVPSYVKDWFFDERKNGYNPLDIKQLQDLAKEKCLKWKAEGIQRVHIYLSGLTSATVAALNAVWDTGMSAKLYHYSFLLDKWLPQTLAFFKDRDTTSSLMSSSELQAWNEEQEARKELTLTEYLLFVGYARIFQDVMQEADSGFIDFTKVKQDIHDKYVHVNDTYIDLMKPYFDTRKKQEVPYNVKLREAIKHNRNSRNKAKVNQLIRAVLKGGTYRRKRS